MGAEIGVVAARAEVLLDAGRQEQALSVAQSVFSTDTDHPGLRRVIGLALVRLHRIDDALDFTAAALARRPEDILNLELRREALRASGDLDGAEAAARRSLALTPDAPWLRLGLAGVLLSKDRSDLLEAKALTDGVLAVTPDDLAAIDTAARISFNLEDLGRFRELVRRGLELSPQNGNLLLLASMDPDIDGNRRRAALRAVLSAQPMSDAGRLGMSGQIWAEWSIASRATWMLAVLFGGLLSLPALVPTIGGALVVAALGFRAVAEWRVRRLFPAGYAFRAMKADWMASGAALGSLGALLASYALVTAAGSSSAFMTAAGLGLLAALLASVAGARIPRAAARTAGVPYRPSLAIHIWTERKGWWQLLRAGQILCFLGLKFLHGFELPAGGVLLLAVGVGWLAVLPWAVARSRETGWGNRQARNAVLWAAALFILDIGVGVFQLVVHRS